MIALIQRHVIDLILLAVGMFCFGLAILLYYGKKKEEGDESSIWKKRIK
jgi:hypothetical protein